MAASRRDFVKTVGGVFVSFSVVESLAPLAAQAAVPLDRLDSWLHVGKDGMVTLFTGKVDIGMGVRTSLAQVVAEEMDVDLAHVTLVMGDTAQTPDQGGVGGSTTTASGAKPIASAAASARFVLVAQASQQLNVPVEQLTVTSGVVSGGGKSITYGELASAPGLSDVLRVTGNGQNINLAGKGKVKDPSTYKVIGQSVPRVDLPSKIFGQATYITDMRVDGMAHGRVIRPNAIGAKFVSLDDSAAKKIPGYLQTVVKGNFVGVVAQTEWASIKALRAVRVTWGPPAVELPQDLYQHMRTVQPKSTREGTKRGDAEAVIAAASKKVSAAYQWPYQAHATMGPGCAVADFHADGVSTVWCGTQKPHALQQGLAELVQVPVERMRVIWIQDAGTYGRAGNEDVAGDALLLSQAIGTPVRVQWMRDDMTRWGGKGPATVFDLAAALDDTAGISALNFVSRTFSGAEIRPQATTGGNLLAGQLAGMPNPPQDEFVQAGEPEPLYRFANLHSTSHIVPSFIPLGSPLRATHLRDPNGPAAHFALESFMDEAALAAGADPVEFRLKMLAEPRARAVLTAAAERFGWKTTWKKTPGKGRGIAVSMRGGTYVATASEVEVNRATGAVRVVRLVCAHDCGLIVNPLALRTTVGANLVQSTSRALFEEVKFDKTHVTSVDWATYPIARASDVPAIDVILINHPELPSTGAGEPSSRPTAASIANAIFDAVGARVRTAPLTAERVKAALV